MEVYSEDIASEIRGFLLDDDWNFSFDEEKGIFKFGINISGKMKHVNYIVPVHRTAYSVYAISTVSADSDDPLTMAEMAKFVCWANYGLKNGNFELDMRDGEIRYKVYVDCEGQLPSRDIVHTSIVVPAMMYERYSKGILDVIFLGASAEEAVKKCEDM